MTEQLKPCPFCGANVRIKKKLLLRGSLGSPNHYRYKIYCHKCGCRIRLEGNDTFGQTNEEAKANAIKAWNRRAYDKSN